MAVAFIVLAPLTMRMAAAATQHTPGIAGKFPRRSRHPDKKEEAVTHKSRSAMGKPKETAGHSRRTPENQPGGREFGQVIEPMQAQMASGNEGLADSSGSKSGAKPSGGGKKPKAA
jgi:hypothetical protein